MSRGGLGLWRLALVVVGTVTAYAVWIQARETSQATKAMGDSLPIQNKAASAASANAEALINAERPWLFIFPVGFTLQGSLFNRLDWWISNRGRTVANVIEVKLRCRKCRGMEKILTSPPEYKLTINFYGVPVAPDGTLAAWSDIEKEKTGSNGFSAEDAEDAEDIRLRGDDLVAFAYVKYRDQFGNLHESRFCYYWAVPFNEFRVNLVAPAEYHECT